jgi:hypothetical protein
MTDFESIDPEFIDTLESTGIIDAYEYVLRKLIDDSLPKEGVYEKCARYLLEYQKLLLEHNIRAKNAQTFYELSNLDTGKSVEKPVGEIIPTFPVTLRSKLLLEQDENKKPKKIFEASIDELIKNRLNLLSKKAFNDEIRSNIKEYGTFSAYVENENEKLRMYDFKINVKFDNFQFTPLEEIEKDNPDNANEEIKINDTNSYNNTNNKNTSNNNISKKTSRKSSQRRNTEKSKESESESVQSKSVTPSEASKIKKESEDVIDELFSKYKKNE